MSRSLEAVSRTLLETFPPAQWVINDLTDLTELVTILPLILLIGFFLFSF